ncbi:MAG: YncE family protein [Myxococcales bacterium]|nr:YncE family protein [Myxococcales bacterium]
MRSLRSHFMPLAAVAGTTALVLLQLVGCGGDDPANPGAKPGIDDPDGGEQAGGPLTIAPGPSRGSAIAISADDSTVVAVNRDVGSISVFSASYPDDGTPAKLEKKAEVPVGGEPWQVVLSPDGDSAYVVLRKDQKLVKVGGLKTTPAVAGSVAVGSEPTGVALTPGGTRAWVANWVDGTLTGVDTAAMTVGSTIDLNTALVATGLLGPDAKARPALAHPRSVAITNNGDRSEDDESIYVTEYFAQRIEAEADNGANADVAKAGLVYKVKLSDKSVSTIRLAPLADMGFADSNGGKAGCYPNQLQSITIQDRYAYVSSICASPKGPVGVVVPQGGQPNVANVKTTTHGVVSVIDLSADKEATGATASLHARFDEHFTANNVADDGSRRYPAVPADIGFVRGGQVGYVVANGADSVFRVRYDVAQASAITEVSSPTQPFINLNPAGIAADKSGQNPIGIATPNQDAHKRFAFVANDVSRNVSVIDFNTQAIAGGASDSAVVVRASALPGENSTEDRIRKGKRFFNTATGRWSLKGQGWNGCQACHMDGLSDNVTWFFARGPRQSTSLEGSFSKKDPKDQRLFNWTAIFDEVADFEGNTRGISGGVGAIVHTKSTPPANADRIDPAAVGAAGLAGSIEHVVDTSNPLNLAQKNVLTDWEEIKAYIQQIRAPRSPSNLDGAKVNFGRQIFLAEGSCQGCHGGDKWTISRKFYEPSTQTNQKLASTAWAPPAGFPVALLPATDQRFMRFANGDVGALDQLQCILRPVGTFAKADTLMGKTAELRQNMTAAGQGNETNGRGFNPPSLLGVQVGAPFFHSGGAATLESLFSPTFKEHYQALAPNLLTEADPNERAAKVEQLVQFLLSIDGDTTSVPIPAAGGQGGTFCAPPP